MHALGLRWFDKKLTNRLRHRARKHIFAAGLGQRNICANHLRPQKTFVQLCAFVPLRVVRRKATNQTSVHRFMVK